MMLQSKDIWFFFQLLIQHVQYVSVTSTASLDTIRLCKSPSVMLASELPSVAPLMGSTPVLRPALRRTNASQGHRLIIHMSELPCTRMPIDWLNSHMKHISKIQPVVLTTSKNCWPASVSRRIGTTSYKLYILGKGLRSEACLAGKFFSTVARNRKRGHGMLGFRVSHERKLYYSRLWQIEGKKNYISLEEHGSCVLSVSTMYACIDRS